MTLTGRQLFDAYVRVGLSPKQGLEGYMWSALSTREQSRWDQLASAINDGAASWPFLPTY